MSFTSSWRITLCALMTACGASEPREAPLERIVAADASAPTATSLDAVRATADSNAACRAIRPFYWELGDANQALVGNAEGCCWNQNTRMSIASASKWLYAAYYLERTGGALSDEEAPLLNFTSGYVHLNGACVGQTVHGCNQSSGNTAPVEESVGRFHYGSGHLESHADRFGGLGAERALTLGDTLRAELGSEIALSYINPLLAGGGTSSAAEYAKFLRKLLSGQLELAAHLGERSVCTLSPEYAALFGETCNAEFSPWWPTPSGKLSDTPDPSLVQNVRYSLAHWVEADGSFSSPGLYGFYPFIDRDRRYYGIVARQELVQIYDVAHPESSAYALSVRCGQALRNAWLRGVAID